ncbi:MAG: hypothetical protein FJX21_19500, partial [Alphaproteobacteria bacterium]|nr:hypothetical protein [Alphaproteobacteria bacterium]
MAGLAAMARAGDRELRLRKREGVGGAALHQRQRLQELDRRAREDRRVDVAAGGEDAAIDIDDDEA